MGLTMQDFNKYCISVSTPSSLEMHTPGSGQSGTSGMSESQLILNNFSKATQKDITAYPTFKNKKYYDAFCHALMLPPRLKEWTTSLTQSVACNTLSHMLNCFFQSNSPSCTLFWSFFYRLSEERSWSRDMRMMHR